MGKIRFAWAAIRQQPGASVPCLHALAFSHSQKTCRLTGDCKLPVGVYVSVNICLSPCVSLYVCVIDYQPVQAAPLRPSRYGECR